MICAVNAEFLDEEFSPVTIISWESKKLPRVARSTPSAETQALSEMVGELDYVRLAMYEFEYGPVHDPHQAFQRLREIEAVAVVDCKPTYAAMVMSESSALGLTDKHMAIEAIACRQDIQDGGALVRWVHSEANPADGFTKIDAKSLEPLMAVIMTGMWKLVHDPEFISSRKRKEAGTGVLETDPKIEVISKSEACAGFQDEESSPVLVCEGKEDDILAPATNDEARNDSVGISALITEPALELPMKAAVFPVQG